MLRLSNNRIFLWQWDANQTLVVEREDVTEVHFRDLGGETAMVLDVIDQDGKRVVPIPNVLLTEAKPIDAYAYRIAGDMATLEHITIEVKARQRPADYVYTETEVKRWETLEERIKALEQAGGGIVQETDPTVPEWAKQPEKPTYTAAEVGAATKESVDKLSEEIEQIKENGGSGGDSSAYFETVHIPGKNLLNLETMEAGYITPAGAVASSNTSYKTSDYIAVDAGDILAGSWIPADTQIQTAMKMRYVANYTAGKVFISTVDNNADTYTVPENTAYIRASLYTNTYKTQQLQIEKTANGVFTEYEDYGDKAVVQLKPTVVVPEVEQARGGYNNLNMRLNAMSTGLSWLNLPDKLYALVGEELNVYFDNILTEGRDTDYEWDVVCTVGQQMARGYVLTAEEAGEYPITIIATKNGHTVTAESVIVVSATAQGNGVTRSLLILGDSTTNNSKLTEKITENFAGHVMNITLLGTRGEAPNSHEGRAGWTLALYHTKAEHNGVANPFYNPVSGAFDATYYFSNTGVAVPDYFAINLGINDMFGFADDATAETGIATALGLLDDTIASVRAAAPNTKICVALTIPPNYSQDAFGKAYKCNQTRDRYKRNNALWVAKLIETHQGREAEGIYLLPLNTNLDTRYNMGFEAAQVNKRNSETYQQPIGNGGVHPAESGYWQTADVYWFFVKSFET